MRESQFLRLSCGKMREPHGEGKSEGKERTRRGSYSVQQLQGVVTFEGVAPGAEANDTPQPFRHNWRREGYVVFCIPCCMKGRPPRPESQRNIASLGMKTLWWVSDFVRQNETGTHHPRRLGVAKRAVPGDDRSLQYFE